MKNIYNFFPNSATTLNISCQSLLNSLLQNQSLVYVLPLKNEVLAFLMLSLITIKSALAQDVDLSKMSTENTWFKVGLNAGLPLQSTSVKESKFILGLDASLQFLETKASGIGIKSGYSHYFSAIDNVKSIGEIPLAIMYRFYPKTSGFFTGLDIGYSFIVNSLNTKGGFMGRPHMGYHGDNWNIFGYYNIVLIEEANQSNIQSLGISITRNIRLRGK